MDKLDPFIVRCKDDNMITRHAAAAQSGKADIAGLARAWNVPLAEL